MYNTRHIIKKPHVLLVVAVLEPAHGNRLVNLDKLRNELLDHHHHHHQLPQAVDVPKPEPHVQQSAVGVHELEGEHLRKKKGKQATRREPSEGHNRCIMAGGRHPRGYNAKQAAIDITCVFSFHTNEGGVIRSP